MILVTEAAWQKIEEKLTESGYNNLRVSLSNKGCGGSSYVFEPTNDERNKTDYHINNGSFTVLVPRETHRLIDGSTIDWVEENAFKSSFDILHNQHEMSRCGCGESVILE